MCNLQAVPNMTYIEMFLLVDSVLFYVRWFCLASIGGISCSDVMINQNNVGAFYKLVLKSSLTTVKSAELPGSIVDVCSNNYQGGAFLKLS